MTDRLRRPDPGLRSRRREPGSSVLPVAEHAVSPPPVGESMVSETPLHAERPAASGSAVLTADRDGASRGPGRAASDGGDRDSSDAAVLRSTGSMAVANLASRLTGFVRMILILAVLGPAVASAFNTANLLPNMITELVLGSVLTAMFMPLLARSAHEDPDGGTAFVRRLVTLTGTVALGATALSVVGAPLLTRLNLGDGEVNTTLATSFAYLLLPQILFYGLFSVLLSVLNYRGEFRAGAWAPVWNNVVAVATLGLYALLGSQIDADAPVSVTDPHVLLLGLGTTAGVAVQVLVLLPALRRAGVELRPLWGVDARLRQFGASAAAGLIYVLISQAGLVVTNRIAAAADAGAVAIYQTHWLLLQVPYGILGVTLLTAINPRLADNGTAGRDAEVVRDVSLGSRLLVLGLVPVVAVFATFGVPLATGLFAYGRFDPSDAHILGLTLAAGAATLIPFAIVLLQQRVFYAREDYWTPTAVILGVTVVRTAASYLVPHLADDRTHVVIGLAAANGAGWAVGAMVGYVLLRRSLGPLDGASLARSLAWTVGAAALGCGLAYGLDTLASLDALGRWLGSPGEVVRVAIDAAVALAVTALVLWRSGLPEVRGLAPLLRRATGLLSRLTGSRRAG